MQLNEKTSSKKRSQGQKPSAAESGVLAEIAAKSAARKPARKTGGKPSEKTVKVIISSEERNRLISEAAYFLAEQRGFESGDPVRDWLEAEALIDKRYQVKT